MWRKILKAHHGHDVEKVMLEYINSGMFDHYYSMHVANHYVGHNGKEYMQYGRLDKKLFLEHSPVVTFGRGFNVYWNSHIMVDWESGGTYHTLRTNLDVNQFPKYVAKTAEYETYRGGIIRGPFDYLDHRFTTSRCPECLAGIG